MNCLCCGKPLRDANEPRWHKSCIRKFFGVDVIPEIDISDDELELIVKENISRGITIPGVQKKLSLHLFSNDKRPRLTLVNYPTGYILKPQVSEFIALPESEHLVMSMADKCNISTVPHALIYNSEKYAYITKRIDRVFYGEKVSFIAMEDFCQLDLRVTHDKYKGSYERCAKIIEKYSKRPMLDLSELFLRLVFCFITGNSDMHLKNFSLIETFEGNGEYILSPAYDLLPVNVIMPEDKEEMALTLNGKKNNIRRKDFIAFADSCNISRISSEKMIDKLLSKKELLLDMCEESLVPNELKTRLSELIKNRCDRISNK